MANYKSSVECELELNYTKGGWFSLYTPSSQCTDVRGWSGLYTLATEFTDVSMSLQRLSSVNEGDRSDTKRLYIVNEGDRSDTKRLYIVNGGGRSDTKRLYIVTGGGRSDTKRLYIVNFLASVFERCWMYLATQP